MNQMTFHSLNHSLSVLLVALLVSGCISQQPQGEKKDSKLLLDPSLIQVRGELNTRLMKNFDRLEEEIYQPENVYMTEEASNWWPGDKEGRTILALTKLARATGRTPKYLDAMIKLFPEKVNEKGYFGTIHAKGVIDEQQLSSHGWVLRGLCEYYLWKKDPAVLGYINRIIDNLVLPTKGYHQNYPIDPAIRKHGGHESGNRINEKVGNWILSTDIGCDFIFMDGVVQAYQVTKREEIKPVIDEMIRVFRKTDFIQIKAQTHATLTGLRALVRYYQVSGDSSLIQTVEKDFDLYRKFARTENYANYNWFGRPEWTEPCAIVDSYMLSMQLWQITGKPEYAGDAQLIYYNALGFGQRANGGFGTDNCSGVNTVFLQPDTYEAYWCCTMRGGEGLASVSQSLFFKGNQSIWVPSFENASVNLKLENDSILLDETTDYPFGSEVNFKVKETNLHFATQIKLLAPEWIKNPEVFINGKKIQTNLENGFICFTQKLNKGDQISYRFKLKSGAEKLENPNSLAGYHKYFYGPLILGYKGKEEINLSQNAEFELKGNKTFSLRNDTLQFIPVYHLLNPEVKKDLGYQVQVIFKNE
jgi:hypothetical protein